MILVNTDTFPNKEYEPIGLVKGSVVWSKHIGRDIMSGLKTIVGGEIKGYTEMMEESREVSTSRMIDEAVKLGADAIICVRYSTSAVMQGASEVMAYGTAIKFK